MSMNELQELPKKPSELMERLTNETDLNRCLKSDMMLAYFSDFLTALQLRFLIMIIIIIIYHIYKG